MFVLLYADTSNPDMPMIWIFPYFFEPRILECLPSFSMLDYQVQQIALLINSLLLLMETTLFFLRTINTPVNYIPKQVDYDNHPLYKHGKTGRKQSPVRLFTNISPRDIVLPKEEGYRYHHHRLYTLWRQVGNMNHPRVDALSVLRWNMTV